MIKNPPKPSAKPGTGAPATGQKPAPTGKPAGSAAKPGTPAGTVKR